MEATGLAVEALHDAFLGLVAEALPAAFSFQLSAFSLGDGQPSCHEAKTARAIIRSRVLRHALKSRRG
eukprot:15457225-Alexandrium_andersonii.AAC.1